jgi:hypothetical protein
LVLINCERSHGEKTYYRKTKDILRIHALWQFYRYKRSITGFLGFQMFEYVRVICTFESTLSSSKLQAVRLKFF